MKFSRRKIKDSRKAFNLSLVSDLRGKMSATVTQVCCSHRYQRDSELCPPGDGELRPDQTLDSHDDIFHRLRHLPKNPSGRSTDQHLLCCGRRAALNLWETLQVRLHFNICREMCHRACSCRSHVVT